MEGIEIQQYQPWIERRQVGQTRWWFGFYVMISPILSMRVIKFDVIRRLGCNEIIKNKIF